MMPNYCRHKYRSNRSLDMTLKKVIFIYLKLHIYGAQDMDVLIDQMINKFPAFFASFREPDECIPFSSLLTSTPSSHMWAPSLEI
jgi:hypothetical protein